MTPVVSKALRHRYDPMLLDALAEDVVRTGSRTSLARLVSACTGLCVQQVRRIIPSLTPFSPRWDDLVAEGLLALVEYTPRYEPERGSFFTFARPWVFARICTAVRAETPVCGMGAVLRGRRMIDRDLDRRARAACLPAHSVEAPLLPDQPPIKALLPAHGESADEALERFREEKRLATMMEQVLSERERQIVTLCHLADPSWSAAEVARTVGVSRQMINWVEHRALRKLAMAFEVPGAVQAAQRVRTATRAKERVRRRRRHAEKRAAEKAA